MKRLLVSLALAPLSIGVAFATVNVNTAQQSELVRVKGLDRNMARTLIVYRNQNGPYDSLEDLQKVPGFSQDVVARVGSEIAFTGDAYVPKAPAKKDEKEKPKK